MMADQMKMVERLKAYAEKNNISGAFSPLATAPEVMCRSEEVEVPELEWAYECRICVYLDGSVKVYSFTGFSPEDKDRDKVSEYFEQVDEKSEYVSFAFANDIIFVSAEFDARTIAANEDSLDEIIFVITRQDMVDCMSGLDMLLGDGAPMEKAVEYCLNGADGGMDTAKLLDTFENKLMVEAFFEDKQRFISSCMMEGTDENEQSINYVFDMFNYMAQSFSMKHDFDEEEFEANVFNVSDKLSLLMINFPAPEDYGLCFQMDVLFEPEHPEKARLFTRELSEDEDTLLCGWTYEEGKKTHLIFGVEPVEYDEFCDLLISIYDGARPPHLAETIED